MQQTDKAYADEAARSIRAGLAANLNDRDRTHLQAAQEWNEGCFHKGTARLGFLARENPRDLLALQYAHVGCFLLGTQHELRDWPLQILRAFGPGDDGRSYVLGMAAFGLEECGDYGRAEQYGREAAEIDPRDGWAVHAVAHVHEMRGDLDQGIPWLADNAQSWAPESGFAYHNWWHLALLHLDRGDVPEVLRYYDEQVRPDPHAQVLLEWIDASALLWRLRIEDIDTGDRFASLADCWERAAADGIYAFNDLHAVMAFLGAGRLDSVDRTLRTMRRVAGEPGDNGFMTRSVGLPLAEALIDFDAGRYGECAEKIAAVRGVAQRFGGSHAQRDILSLTALHAALREGMADLAQSFAAERLAHKPHSPWAQRLGVRAENLRKQRHAA
ncbi:tetratricopeptide repeat protein [Rhizorhapis sp. SPR117]|uniref:tetratricopeptide repeat protein n=1 Tax=Rhizorhapis sp. SPR117 TaxID=2912611 RepID=UPI001F16C76D|nr:tetratricopeptide repeat protein [Rhizorhapis sp. SPR117]